jgi:hypothetical protein
MNLFEKEAIDVYIYFYVRRLRQRLLQLRLRRGHDGGSRADDQRDIPVRTRSTATR